MRDKHLKKAMASVFEQLELDPETPYRVEPYVANLWISSLYRVVIESADGRPAISLFVKLFPEDPQRLNFFDSHFYFSNEASAYTKVIAAFTEFQRVVGIMEPIQFTPRCYFAECNGDNDILVFEDLSTQGYSVPSCKQPMDLQNLNLLMQTLGQFHALSLAIKNLQPQRFADIRASVNETTWTDRRLKRIVPNLWDRAGREMLELLVQSEGPDSKYVVKLTDVVTNNSRSLQKISRADPENEPWNVMTHGDLWSSNLLVRSGQTLRFVDLQQCRYGSPALDLSSVLFLSMDGPMRAKYGDALLQLYHQSLSQFLQRLGVDPEQVFPFHAVEEQLKKYGRYGMGVGLLNIPHAMQESLEGELKLEGDMTMADAVSKERGQMSARCRQRILDNFRDVCDRGYLDF
ncbi:uncharacterized protein [Periplaneta americana]